MPFENFITIRPENIFGAYVNSKTKSIVPGLIKKLTQSGFNILYLPRCKEDKKYCESSKNVYIPSMPLLGLDVCYYSQAVLTGAGTFAREAALVGTPAVFFPGKYSSFS
jgi:predicted glycosyltransferase